MADDKTKVGQANHRQVTGEDLYEVEYFARKQGLSLEQAQDLIARYGNDRRTVDAAAEVVRD